VSTACAAYVRDARGVRDAMIALIGQAERSIVLQMYLFAANGHLSLVQPRADAAPHAAVVADALIARQRRSPAMPIVVVLDSNTPDDPARVVTPSTLIAARLREAGVVVLTANLFHNRFDRARRLPAAARLHRRQTQVPVERWVEVQHRWQVIHNVEDHRKNLVIDEGARALVTSHNLIDVAHDWHENAFVVGGAAARTIFAQAQEALARALEIPQRLEARPRQRVRELAAAPRGGAGGDVGGDDGDDVTVLASEQIRPRFEAVIDAAGPGAALDLATAYFSDLRVWHRLVAAARRGARVRALVDDLVALPLPRVHAAVVRGLANRAVLDAARSTDVPGLELRVFHSAAGAMMHLKTLIRRGPDPVVIGGQCNATPNSFNGAWTETDVELSRPDVVAAASAHVDWLWSHPASRALPPPGPWFGPRRRLAAAALAGFAMVGLAP
jgi:phosphatidylserine/phosphatidylglycerophosphate/cardiolipin synthase-like enzyme